MSGWPVRQVLLLLGLALVPALVQGVFLRDRASWRSRVSPSDLVDVATAQRWGDSAIWLDARPDNEFAEAHVPGALPLNEDRWDELLPPLLQQWSPGKKIVVYCSSKSCNLAADVARRLREEAQLKDVFVLKGGWEAWVSVGKHQ